MPSEELMRLLASRPASDGLARLAVAVGGRGTKAVRARRLRGGVDSSVHAVLLDPGGWVVLKRGRNAARVADELDRLGFARQIPVRTPEPLAIDRTGEWFGRPALVMSRLPGRTRLHRVASDVWIEPFAAALATIHAFPVPAATPALLRDAHAWQVWTPPPLASLGRGPRAEAVLEAATALQRDLRARPPAEVVTHHDFHSRNVVWHRDRLSGVLDWNEARLGPAVSDVAYCSVDLTMSHGRTAADLFVTCYGRAAALDLSDLSDLWRWQLFWLAVVLQWLHYWELSFEQAGLALPRGLLRRRLTSLADRLLVTAG